MTDIYSTERELSSTGCGETATVAEFYSTGTGFTSTGSGFTSTGNGSTSTGCYTNAF